MQSWRRYLIFGFLVGIVAAILFPLYGCAKEQGATFSAAKGERAASAPTGGAAGGATAAASDATSLAMEKPQYQEAAKRVALPKAATASGPGVPGGRRELGVSYRANSQSGAIRARTGGAAGSRVAGASPYAPTVAPAVQNPNMYVASNYAGGSGERERMEKLIREGVLVEGKRVKLEAFAQEYTQNFPIPTDRALSVTAETERTKIITSGDRTYLQVGLQAMEGEAPRRPPLNIALVIDRSGSMGGENKFVEAKAAARELVNRLRGDDVLSIVTFHSTASVLVPAGSVRDKAALKETINSLQMGGGTNIYDGLKLGFREAKKNAYRENGVNLVLLLSDGEVTAGINDSEAFRKLVAQNVDAGDIQTSTVGMGIAFNEELMAMLAREGKGNYHFLKDSGDTTQVFARELDDLSHIVAKAVKVRIDLAPGVGLVRVLGTKELDATQTARVKADEKNIDRKVYEELGIRADRQKQPEEPGIKMLIPNFHRGDSHVVLLEVEVPRGRPGASQKIADVHLKYKDLTRRANRREEASAFIAYTPDRSEMIASINRGVKKNLLGFQTGEALMRASEFIAQGRVSEAVRVLDERMVVLGVAAKEWRDRDLDRDGKLLDRYKVVLSQMNQNPQLAQAELGEYVKKSLTYNGYRMTR